MEVTVRCRPYQASPNLRYVITSDKHIGETPLQNAAVPFSNHLVDDVIATVVQSLKEKYGREVFLFARSKKKPRPYESQEIPLRNILAHVAILPKTYLKSTVASLTRQGSASEKDRTVHSLTATANHRQRVELRDILSFASQECYRLAKKKGVRILVLAGAGLGKTLIFLRKAPQDWARGIIWNDIRLVLAFPLIQSEVHNAKSLKELLRLAGLGVHRQTDSEEICMYITKNPERVCLVLDGLDEIHVERCSLFIQNVMKGTAVNMAGVRVVVTSRPSPVVLKFSKEYPFNLLFELGLRKAALRHYIERVLTPQEAADVLCQIRGSPPLEGLMRIPVHAANVCNLYRGGLHNLPTTLPGVVRAMLLEAIRMNEKKKPQSKAIFVAQNWEGLSADLRNHAMDLAAFAFWTLTKQISTFDESHFAEFNLSCEARGLGLLVSSESASLNEIQRVTFTHLSANISTHESMAALFVSQNLAADDICWLVHQIGALSGHLNTFYKCLGAELSSPTVDKLLKSLCSQPATAAEEASSQSSRPLTRAPDTAAASFNDGLSEFPDDLTYLMTASHSEVLQIANILSSHLDIHKTEALAEYLLGDLVLGSAVQLVKSKMPLGYGREFTYAYFQEQLLLLWRSMVPRTSIHMLYTGLAKLDKSIADSCFPSISLHHSSLVVITQATAYIDVITEEGKQCLLLAGHVFALHCSTTDEKPVLPLFSKFLRTTGALDFDDILLSASDCTAIGIVLEAYPHIITEVSLSRCGIRDTGYSQLSAGLALCRKLTFFNLKGNDLTDKHQHHIADVINNNSDTLQHLYTSDNKFTSAGQSVVHSYTDRCSHLVSLVMGSAKAMDVTLNASTISTVLHGCQRIQYFELYHYTLNTSGVTELADLLSQHQLQMLTLRNVGLTSQHALLVSKLLTCHKQHVWSLDLSKNDLTDDFLVASHGALLQCSMLEDVRLTGTGLSSSSLEVLATLIRQWPRLRFLEIGHNDFGEDNDSFIAAVESCCALEALKMPVRARVNPALSERLEKIPNSRGILFFMLEIQRAEKTYVNQDDEQPLDEDDSDDED